MDNSVCLGHKYSQLRKNRTLVFFQIILQICIPERPCFIPDCEITCASFPKRVFTFNFIGTQMLSKKQIFNGSFLLKKPHFEFKVVAIVIWYHFLRKYVYPSQRKSFLKTHVYLSRSRYSKVQKGKEIEISHRSIETHCQRFRCPALNIEGVIQRKQGV